MVTGPLARKVVMQIHHKAKGKNSFAFVSTWNKFYFTAQNENQHHTTPLPTHTHKKEKEKQRRC